MCTDTCPCPVETTSRMYVSKYSDEQRLHDFNRTARANDLKIYKPFVFIADDELAYFNFYGCYQDIVDDTNTNANQKLVKS